MIVTSRKSCGNQFSPDGKELVGGKRIKRTITVDRSFYDGLWVWLFQWDIKDPTCWGRNISKLNAGQLIIQCFCLWTNFRFTIEHMKILTVLDPADWGDNSSCSAGTRFDKPIQLIEINIAFNRGQS